MDRASARDDEAEAFVARALQAFRAGDPGSAIASCQEALKRSANHAVALRLVPSRAALAYAQVLGDLLILTGLVYFFGGVRTGFRLL